MTNEERAIRTLTMERDRQRRRWGDEHDATHSHDEWLWLLRTYTAKARGHGATDDYAYRSGLAKIGALVLAAIEADLAAEARAQAEGE